MARNLTSMLRSGLLWKVLLPGAGAMLATAVVMSADALPLAAQVLLLMALLAGLTLHAIWITRRVTSVADSIATAISRMGTAQPDERWSEPLPVEAAPLVRAIADLEQRLQSRIDELRRHRTDLSNTTALLESVLGTMVEGVVVLDREQRILFTNPASRPLLDIQSNIVDGRPLWEVSRLPAVNQAVERVLGGQQREPVEYEIPRTRLTVAAMLTPLPRDPVPGVMMVLHDVTELRRLENLRREFVANVSHELKTPLTSIQAYADTLLEEDREDAEQTRLFLEKIVEQTERLGALILDIIRLGKIESEPDVFEVRPVPVGAVVQACLEAHATIADTKQVTLTAAPISDTAAVLADAAEFRTILDNLVDNALHYTPAGGTVDVRLVAEESADRLLGIQVADTGIGLTRDQQQRIFERFYRVDRARDRQRGGTGLGLAIVKHLCQMFSGRIDVESELGAGSRFTVWLPVADGRREIDPHEGSLTAVGKGATGPAVKR
jgi:two-component system, OmpR family, phosphate regulon sensor histidine kinase PhoR